MSSLSVSEHVCGPATADLHVCLLGSPSLAWRGDPLALPRRQARALLYHLVTVLQPVARNRLCLLFWPDHQEAAARCNLSRLISILHNALPDRTLLTTSDDQIGLNHRGIWSDVQAFEQLWATWKDAGQPACLQQAVALYRGPFLSDFSLPDSPEYEVWMTTERQYWERMALQALTALVDDQASKGEYVNAITYAQRYLEIDDLSEEVHRRLMELYALAGDRVAATRQYERLVTVLEHELGLDPLPETQAVYRAVHAGQVLHTISPAAVSIKAHLPASKIPLVGREDAWRTLEEAFAKARSGRGQVVLVSGEVGIGKSRLAQDFREHIQHQCTVLNGVAYPETQTSPYQPIVEALRSKLSMEPFSLDAYAYPAWLTEASRLLPELRALHPGLPEPPTSEPGWARARLFESLEMILTSMAKGVRPVLMCLDDLHWADAATLDWLAYMGHHLTTQRLMILGMYRGEEATAMAELRSRLEYPEVLHEIVLTGLDESMVYQLLCHLNVDFSDRKDLAGRMYTATGGNPFFLLETARALIESGQHLCRSTGSEDLPLPDSVRAAVQARIQRLSSTARQVLEAAAVLGAVFDFDAARLTSGRQESEAADALDELLSRHLLTVHNGGYRFRHELIREAINLELSYNRRRLLHRRAGETLENLHPTDTAALARHFEQAEQPGRAAHYALQAGLAAKHVFAHVEARAWFDRTLTLLAQEAHGLSDPIAMATNLRLRIETLGERGWALRLLGDMQAYARDLDEENRLVDQLGDAHMLAHLRWRQAEAHKWFCRYEDALSAVEEGVALSQQCTDQSLEAHCWRALGLAARSLGDYVRARDALERALALAQDSMQLPLRIHLMSNLSTLFYYLDDYERARNMAGQALAVCEAAQLTFERRLPLGDLGAAIAADGDPIVAHHYLEESSAIARQISDRTQEIYCLGHLGWLCIRERRPNEALEYLQSAQTLAEEIDSRAEQSWLHAGQAQALALAGERTQALGHARRAVALAEVSGCAHDQKLSKETLEKLQ